MTWSLLALALTVAAPGVAFERDVLPVLSERCFRCHGPDAAARKANLRLDTKEGLLGAVDDGPVVSPGRPDRSVLLSRIEAGDEDRMPPAKAGPRMTLAEAAAVRAWIAGGATWRRHWSLDPPTTAVPPRADHPIDGFVRTAQVERGVRPSVEADRRTLLRRVALDLTGLPPTIEEVEAFVGDRRPDAFERQVDRLFQSPAYGEHMARLWLDLARYGDTHGLHRDEQRALWPYRDWVIDAFNRNLPFDQFTVEQLAGDRLPRATIAQRVATGYLRANVSTSEGGAIGDEVLARYAGDRAEAMATTWLGLTAGCAACHDHKYDPISQRDYYALTAYFRGIDEQAMDENQTRVPPYLLLPTPAQRRETQALERTMAALQAKLDGSWSALDRAQAAWERDIAAGGPNGAMRLHPWWSMGCIGWGSAHESLGRGLELEGHPIDRDHRWTSNGRTYAWAPRFEWMDAQITYGLRGELCATYLHRIVDSPDARTITLSLGADDGIKVWINGTQKLEKLTYHAVWPGEVRLKIPLRAGRNELLLKVTNHLGQAGFFFAAEDPLAIPDSVRSLIAVNRRTPEQQAALRAFYRTVVARDPALLATRGQLEQARKRWASVDAAVPATLVAAERPEPRETFVLDRGQYDHPRERVDPNTPSALPPLPPGAPRDRLGLARWLVSPENPLTARVVVNRLWQQLFGVGLVKTSEDFGAQGERPSHPELLDWLATDLRDHGWDVRRSLRLIVTSATYRQTSAASAAARERDPENRWLARGPRGRMDAEVLRDQALAAASLLVRKVGGPSVKPPQPPGLWEEVGVPGANTSSFVADTGADVLRRSLYTFLKRTAPPPTLTIFDAPSRESCTSRRERTNTPTQALVLLNEPQLVASARAMADTAAKDRDDDRALARLWQRATLRPPTAAELTQIRALYAGERTARAGDRRAALAVVANLVLNLDEVVSKE